MEPVTYAVTCGVAVVSVDHPPVNALSHLVRVGLMKSLRRALYDPQVCAVVLRGNGAFLAGADLREMGTAKSTKWPRSVHIQALLEASEKPVIAAIEGNALGGGLEVAMTCHARVATAGARLGLPEVKLGLLPGAGGTVRLPRLVGVEAALELILSGEAISAAEALALGVIDAIVGDLGESTVAYARAIADGLLPTPVITRRARIEGVNPAVFDDARRRVRRSARGEWAPFAIIDCVEAGYLLESKTALAFEQDAFLTLLAGNQHKALIHLFFAEREARKIPGVPVDAPTPPVRKAAIVGAGLVGTGLAIAFADAGIAVTLIDTDARAVARAKNFVDENYAHRVAEGTLPAAQMQQALSLIGTTVDYGHLGDADLAVEAVLDRMDLKREIFAKLDAALPPRAVLATTTPSLDLDEIAAATGRPGQVIGMHFFGSIQEMKLIENVRGTVTSASTIATAMNFTRRLGKAAVLAGNCPGFIGRRMLHFYMAEAQFLLEEGATPEQVDGVAEAFGMAMGPLAMCDMSGLDQSAMRRPGERHSLILDSMVEAGRFGKKNGLGFYRYEGRIRIPDPDVLTLIGTLASDSKFVGREIADAEIRDRLFHPLVNEGLRAIEDGIALRAGDIDLVWTKGYGFPAHRGGPMYWGEAQGLDRVVDTARRLAARNGPQWRPAALLERFVETGSGLAAEGEFSS